VRVRGFDLVLDLEAREQRNVVGVTLETLASGGMNRVMYSCAVANVASSSTSTSPMSSAR
jgi:hypothetical protein